MQVSTKSRFVQGSSVAQTITAEGSAMRRQRCELQGESGAPRGRGQKAGAPETTALLPFRAPPDAFLSTFPWLSLSSLLPFLFLSLLFSFFPSFVSSLFSFFPFSPPLFLFPLFFFLLLAQGWNSIFSLVQLVKSHFNHSGMHYFFSSLNNGHI